MPAVTATGFVPMRVSKVTALGRAVRDDVAFCVGAGLTPPWWKWKARLVWSGG